MNENEKKLSKEAKIGITIAVISIIFFITVLIARNLGTTGRKISSSKPSSSSYSSSSSGSSTGEEETIDLLDEIMNKPFTVTASIYRYFYDLDTPETNHLAMVDYGEGVRASDGVDYLYNDTQFSVYSAFSGKVIKVENDDPIFGKIIQVRSADGLIANYQSLSTIDVSLNQVITRGDKLGNAGTSIWGGPKTLLHFALFREGENPINPEKFFGLALRDIQDTPK